MTRPRTLAILVVTTTFLIAPLAPVVRAADRDKRLEKGIALVEAGEWKKALTELTDAVTRLSRDPKRKLEAADACLYSGLAYVGLGETSPAISQFAQALMRNPKIAIPPGRETPAAADAFEVARREAVAPPEPKHRSKVPYVVGGLAVVGGGVALAAGGGGGGGDSTPSNGIPAVFTVTGSTGTPQLLLLSAVPPSSSTLNLRQGGAPILAFVFNYQANLPGRLKASAELVGASGICMTGRTSEDAVVDPAVATYTLVVNSWNIACSGAFSTNSMNVRLIDADANIPVSLTSYSGGYIFTFQ